MKTCPLCGNEVMIEDFVTCELCKKDVCVECIHRNMAAPDDYVDVCDRCQEDKFD